MGIRTITRADGTIAFEADLRIANVDRITRTFDTREEAEKFLAMAKAEAQKALRASASALLPQAKIGGQRNFERAQLAAVLTLFMDSSACGNRAKKIIVKLPYLIDTVTVAKADEDWCRKHMSQMRGTLTLRRKPYAFHTIKSQIFYMIKACKWWAKQNKVRNPTIDLTTTVIPEGSDVQRDRRLEHGEYERILERINARSRRPAQWRCLIDLCIETGARLQELVLAEWSELGREDQLWRIPEHHTKKKRTRKVPLSPKARAVVAELRSLREAENGRLFEVFTNPHATSMDFGRIVRDAGIVNLRFHDLRHEAISRIVVTRPNVSLRSIMDIVGHRDYASFVRYSHLRDDDLIGLFD